MLGIVVGLIFRQFLIDGGDRQGTLVRTHSDWCRWRAPHSHYIRVFSGAAHTRGCLLPGRPAQTQPGIPSRRPPGESGWETAPVPVGQKPFGIAAGGPTIHLQPAPFVTGHLELLHTRPLREADAHVVRLHQLPRRLRLHNAMAWWVNCRRRLGFTWP